MKDVGSMDKLVEIRKPVVTKAPSGAPRTIYNVQRVCYAHRIVKNNFSKGETYEALQKVEVTEQQWVVRVNSEKQIDSTMVLFYGNQAYEIRKVEPATLKNRSDRNAYLVLTTELKDNE
jgi:hypothetical protein